MLNILRQLAEVKLDPVETNVPTNQLGQGTIDAIVNTTFFVLGAIAVLFLIIGGIRYVISGGDASQTKQAKNTILYAVIGLVIAVFSFAVIKIVIGAFK